MLDGSLLKRDHLFLARHYFICAVDLCCDRSAVEIYDGFKSEISTWRTAESARS